jgi:peptidoglycan/LPS O-acetylase OafA/YrhL
MNLLNHLSRITSSGKGFLPQVDGLRFIAIMAVIAYHVRQICSYHLGVSLESETGTEGLVNAAFATGRLGVPLFFTISGFILALPFARQQLCQGPPVSMRAYYIRRITRLEPPYLIHLAILFVLCGAVLRFLPSHPSLYYTNAWAGYAWSHVFPSVLYSNGLLYGQHPYPNVVLWSLEVEVQFYILAPALAALLMIHSKPFRRGLIVGLILLLTLIGYMVPQVYLYVFSLAGNLQFFLTGFLLCDLYLIEWAAAPKQTLTWDILFFLAVGTIIAVNDQPELGLLLPWLNGVICIAAFRGCFCGRCLANPWLTTIGGMCYTIYMYHWLMISALVRLTERLQTHVFWLDMLIQFTVITAVIIVICAFLFALFERPFMRRDWHSKLWTTIRSQKKPAVPNDALA